MASTSTSLDHLYSLKFVTNHQEIIIRKENYSHKREKLCIVGITGKKMPVMIYITPNAPYFTLMRLCKLQMKHIPLDIGNLIVQEFK